MKRLIVLLCSLLLSGCVGHEVAFAPREGMTRQEVVEILGPPLVCHFGGETLELVWLSDDGEIELRFEDDILTAWTVPPEVIKRGIEQYWNSLKRFPERTKVPE